MKIDAIGERPGREGGKHHHSGIVSAENEVTLPKGLGGKKEVGRDGGHSPEVWWQGKKEVATPPPGVRTIQVPQRASHSDHIWPGHKRIRWPPQNLKASVCLLCLTHGRPQVLTPVPCWPLGALTLYSCVRPGPRPHVSQYSCISQTYFSFIFSWISLGFPLLMECLEFNYWSVLKMQYLKLYSAAWIYFKHFDRQKASSV